MFKKSISMLTLMVSISFISIPAYAKDTGIYVYAGAGYFLTDDADGNLLSVTPANETAHFSHSNEMSYGVGAGYQFNPHFSVDVDATMVNGISLSGAYSVNGVSIGGLVVTTTVDSLYIMSNVYWNFYGVKKAPFGLKPYVGIGAGLAKHSVDTLSYSNGSSIEGSDQTEFAYKLSAGVIKEVFNNVDLDIRYSYIDGGTAESGTLYNNGMGNHPEPMKIDMKSSVLALGIIYRF